MGDSEVVATGQGEHMWHSALRIIGALVLACVVALLTIVGPFAAVVLLDFLFDGAGEPGRGGATALLVPLIAFPLLVGLMLLWLPIVLYSRRRGHRARERVLLFSPLAPLAVLAGAQGVRLLAGAQSAFSFEFLPVLVLFAPAMMIATAFFFTFDRKLGGGSSV